MRHIHWLLFISVALFISGIGFVIAAARSAREAPPAVEAPATVPIATVAQIMNGITGPAALVVYNAVGTIINADGVKEIAPQNDEEWANVANNAAALIESGNLMLLGDRAIDTGDWVTMTKAMMEKGQAALKAAQAKDKDAILEAGGPLNDTCDTCHAKYQRQ
jgi:hypothetical protein